jgi:hypothetical protein
MMSNSAGWMRRRNSSTKQTGTQVKLKLIKSINKQLPGREREQWEDEHSGVVGWPL